MFYNYSVPSAQTNADGLTSTSKELTGTFDTSVARLQSYKVLILQQDFRLSSDMKYIMCSHHVIVDYP